MATIYVDNKPFTVKDGGNLLHACLAAGLDLPYFCWHPALHAVGACRQCAVKIFRDEKDTTGRIAMACMTPVRDGIRLSVDDPEAKAFRAGVIELLMANHPHDCPVCDEGGECHLQDMTVMTGHTYRAFRSPKRTHRNQDLGPFVNHEMNRCIACYRCVRFYRDYAGGSDLEALAGHDAVYFGRPSEGALESEFSGNLVEVCPTGVFTDKLFRKRFTRVWDLATAPSVCMHCSLGCNVIPGERYGTIRRIRNRYNYDVNGYFICDRGRFGYGYVNAPARLRAAISRAAGASPATIDRGEAVRAAANALAGARGVIGIGSPRASLETNFALKTLVGAAGYCSGLSRRDSALADAALSLMQSTPLRQATLREAALADAVLILGEDLLNTAPLLGLAVRQTRLRRSGAAAQALGIPPWDDGSIRRALQNEKSPLFVLAAAPTKLDAEATLAVRSAPADIARLGYLIAAEVAGNASAVSGTREPESAAAKRIAEALLASSSPLIVWGVSSGSIEAVAAAGAIAAALAEKKPDAAMAAVLPESNSCGAAILGGRCLEEALASLAKGEADTLVIAENDLLRRLPGADAAALFASAKQVIVLDHTITKTVEAATIALPAASFAESIGTVVSSEGRAQRFFKVFTPEGDIRESWQWLRDILDALGRPEGGAWKNFDGLAASLAASMPVFEPLRDLAPGAQYLLDGRKVPRQGGRCSGRTAIRAALQVAEGALPEDPDSPLGFTMEGARDGIPPPLNSRYSAPGWNSVQALTAYQTEPGGPLSGGESGRRLIEPHPGKSFAPVASLPEPHAAVTGEWLAVAMHHLYGSEELSMLSPAIAACSPKPSVALCAQDAAGLSLANGDLAEIGAGIRLTLPCRIVGGLPAGIAGLPAGFPGLPVIAMPCRITIRKAGGGA